MFCLELSFSLSITYKRRVTIHRCFPTMNRRAALTSTVSKHVYFMIYCIPYLVPGTCLMCVCLPRLASHFEYAAVCYNDCTLGWEIDRYFTPILSSVGETFTFGFVKDTGSKLTPNVYF